MIFLLINIRNEDCTEVWDGIFYKKLSHYPDITDWELRTIIEFISYEELYGRQCTISCENTGLLDLINKSLLNKAAYRNVPRPALITECTACPTRKGCETEFVCHTTSVENAKSILSSGKLLSAVKARQIPVEQLMAENRNAANDPADYFEYIMFAWGNCQAGDRLVMERKLGRFPDEASLSIHFTPGVRFYFRYDDLAKHPNVTFDGVLPMKIKDELCLSDYIYTIVIPDIWKEELEPYIPESLKNRVMYITNDCGDIWEWSEKVYQCVENLKHK